MQSGRESVSLPALDRVDFETQAFARVLPDQGGIELHRHGLVSHPGARGALRSDVYACRGKQLHLGRAVAPRAGADHY